MKAIPFPQANKVLKAPPSPRNEIQEQIDALASAGVDVVELQAKLDAALPPDQEAYDLPVWYGLASGAYRCISCWEASAEERMRLAASGPVWLWVVGHTHPPLVLDAENPFEPAQPVADTFPDWWGVHAAEIVAEMQDGGIDVAGAEEIAEAVYRRLFPLVERPRKWAPPTEPVVIRPEQDEGFAP